MILKVMKLLYIWNLLKLIKHKSNSLFICCGDFLSTRQKLMTIYKHSHIPFFFNKTIVPYFLNYWWHLSFA